MKFLMNNIFRLILNLIIKVNKLIVNMTAFELITEEKLLNQFVCKTLTLFMMHKWRRVSAHRLFSLAPFCSSILKPNLEINSSIKKHFHMNIFQNYPVLSKKCFEIFWSILTLNLVHSNFRTTIEINRKWILSGTQGTPWKKKVPQLVIEQWKVVSNVLNYYMLSLENWKCFPLQSFFVNL